MAAQRDTHSLVGQLRALAFTAHSGPSSTGKPSLNCLQDPDRLAQSASSHFLLDLTMPLDDQLALVELLE